MARREKNASLYTESGEFKSLLGVVRFTCGYFQSVFDEKDNISKDRLIVRLMDLEPNYAKFNDACATLLGFLDTSIDRQEYDDLQAKINLARDQVTELRLKLSEFRPTPIASSTPTRPSHAFNCDYAIPRQSLPDLPLPRFDGSPESWVSFHDQFKSMVDLRSDLTQTQKMQYLVGSLSDEPRRLIQHLRIEDSNYEVACDLLKNRYHNLRLQADTLIAQLLNLPEIPPRLTGLRASFLNPLLSAYRALERLRLPVNQWSYLLVHMCLNKLPADIKARFERRHGGDVSKLPTFDQLIVYLEEECRHNETVGNMVVDSVTTKTVPTRAPLPRRTYLVDTTVPAKPNPKCYYCASVSHYLRECRSFLGLPPRERAQFVKSHSLCYRCLDKHYIDRCPKAYKCSSCGKSSHHTLLCFNNSRSPQYAPVNPDRSQRSPSPRMGGGGFTRPPKTPSGDDNRLYNNNKPAPSSGRSPHRSDYSRHEYRQSPLRESPRSENIPTHRGYPPRDYSDAVRNTTPPIRPEAGGPRQRTA